MEKVIQDYGFAGRRCFDIGLGRSRNGLVLDGDGYLNPTVMHSETERPKDLPKGRPYGVPLDNPFGEYQYYSRIATVLEMILTGHRVPADMMPEGAPAHIQRFQARSN